MQFMKMKTKISEIYEKKTNDSDNTKLKYEMSDSFSIYSPLYRFEI